MNKIQYFGFSNLEEAKKAGMSATWKVYPATPGGTLQAIQDGYKAVSIYEFSHPVELGKPIPIVYGDLFLDFDAKMQVTDESGNTHAQGDIDKSLRAIRTFIHILVNKFNIDPNDLKIWASGGKGFHLCIPRQLIGSEAGDSMLPKIYRGMIDTILRDLSCRELWDGVVHEALRERQLVDLEDFCIDSNTFKGGKGQLLRLPHIKRLDGNYKVPVTYEEILKMDFSFFKEIVKQDRELPCESENKLIEKNSGLEELF